MAKKLLVFAAAIVFVALAVVFMVDFESPELGKAVLEKATETTGAKLSVERFRLNLIRGLELEGVEATSSLPGTIVDTRIDKLILRHRWLPLLSGRVAVDQLLIRRPELVLVERGAARKKKSAKGTKAKKESQGAPSGANRAGGESDSVSHREESADTRAIPVGDAPGGTDLEGIVHLDGPLALKLLLRTPREGLVINEVPDEVLDALTDEEGWVAIPFRITGTRDEPKVLPDAKSLLTGGGTQRLIERGIKSFLNKK